MMYTHAFLLNIDLIHDLEYPFLKAPFNFSEPDSISASNRIGRSQYSSLLEYSNPLP